MYAVLRTSCRPMTNGSTSCLFRRAVQTTGTRSLVITTEIPKANPHFMKFTLDREVLPTVYGPEWPISHSEEDMIAVFPLAANIFKINGGKAIDHILFKRTFINVAKQQELSWKDLEPAVHNAILDFYAYRNPVFELDPPPYVPHVEDDEEDIAEENFENVTYAEKRRRDGHK